MPGRRLSWDGQGGQATLASTFYNNKKLQAITTAVAQPVEEDREKTKEEVSFDLVVPLARKHNLRVDEVKKKWEQFHMFDSNGDIELSHQEFQHVVRVLCGIPDEEPIPSHLFSACWTASDLDGDGAINFEEFLLWSNGVQYTEEMMVPDPQERLMRRIAREYDMDVVAVERIKAIFDKFDPDTKGVEEQGFKDLVCELLHTTVQDFSDNRLKRHWREVNPTGGLLSFKDFAVWWNVTFGMNAQPDISHSASSNPLHSPASTLHQASSKKGSMLFGNASSTSSQSSSWRAQR